MADFKRGDWVVITKSRQNWSRMMDRFVGKVVQITSINKNQIDFVDCGIWGWCFKNGHFRKALPEEIPGYVGEPNYEIY